MAEPLPILTPRLRLEPLLPAAIGALLAGDLPTAEAVQDRHFPAEFVDSLDDHFLAIQRDRMKARPSARGWCARVMVALDDGSVVGHCGFHGPPEDVGRAEIGYTVLTDHRGRGYATEAAGGLVAWARAEGATEVVASVRPDNAASLRVVVKLGFEQTGVQIDEIDGEELVFTLAW